MKEQVDLQGQTGSPRRRSNRGAASGTLTASLSIVRRVRALLRRGEEGSALVEVALTMPILMAAITAVATFAIGFNNQLTLTSAVGSGAQYLQLIRTTTSDPCAQTLTAIENAAPSLTGSSIKLSFNFNGTVVTGNSCPNATSDLAQLQPVTVSATYPCVISIMPMGYGTNFVSSCQLSAKVTEYEY
jgi:Flp pilus assembly protein TadG